MDLYPHGGHFEIPPQVLSMHISNNRNPELQENYFSLISFDHHMTYRSIINKVNSSQILLSLRDDYERKMKFRKIIEDFRKTQTNPTINDKQFKLLLISLLVLKPDNLNEIDQIMLGTSIEKKLKHLSSDKDSSRLFFSVIFGNLKRGFSDNTHKLRLLNEFIISSVDLHKNGFVGDENTDEFLLNGNFVQDFEEDKFTNSMIILDNVFEEIVQLKEDDVRQFQKDYKLGEFSNEVNMISLKFSDPNKSNLVSGEELIKYMTTNGAQVTSMTLIISLGMQSILTNNLFYYFWNFFKQEIRSHPYLSIKSNFSNFIMQNNIIISPQIESEFLFEKNFLEKMQECRIFQSDIENINIYEFSQILLELTPKEFFFILSDQDVLQ